jgi:hypothetical protein
MMYPQRCFRHAVGSNGSGAETSSGTLVNIRQITRRHIFMVTIVRTSKFTDIYLWMSFYCRTSVTNTVWLEMDLKLFRVIKQQIMLCVFTLLHVVQSHQQHKESEVLNAKDFVSTDKIRQYQWDVSDCVTVWSNITIFGLLMIKHEHRPNRSACLPEVVSFLPFAIEQVDSNCMSRDCSNLRERWLLRKGSAPWS